MLLDLISEDPKYSGVQELLQKPGQIVHGLTNSAKSFALSQLLEKSTVPIIFFTLNHTDAQTYFKEIKNLSSKPVFNFLSQEISPYDQISSDITVLNHQYQVFESWAKEEASLTVMSYKSLMQLYLSKEFHDKQSFLIRNDLEMDPSDLASKLVGLGYSKEFMVNDRAQFSQRGDIFDIYPLVGEPVRIEFFGEQVESIRVFSLLSQRSVKEITEVKIHPRFNILREEDDGLASKLEEAFKAQLANLKDEAKDNLQSIADSEIQHAEESLYWEGVEYYASFLGQPSSSLLDYLPERPQLIFDEWQDLVFSAEKWEGLLSQQYKDSVAAGKILPLANSDLLHLPFEPTIKDINKIPRRLYLQTMPEASEHGAENDLSIEILSHPPQRFASKVDEFVDYIKTKLREKLQLVIFSEQPQRVLGIMREWDIPAIYLDAIKGSPQKTTQNTVWIQRDGTEEGFSLPGYELLVLTDRELFGRSRQAIARQKVTEGVSRKDVFSDISQINVGDYVVHYKHGVGIYQGTEFVELSTDGSRQEYLIIEYADDARVLLPVDQVNLLSRFNVAGDAKPRLSKLGGMEWERTKKKVKKSVKKVAQELLNIYAARAKQQGYKYPPDTPWQVELEDSFPYSETEDQLKAIAAIKKDMESKKLLDRLICGDAGFGKTEVVLRAVFKTVMEGKQVAILVPTTVLAQQHYNVFSDRFAPYPVKTGLLCRFKTAKEQKDVLERLKIGECDVVIGTHRLLQKDIKFQNLGMLVIDEEQRFGVSHKEKLKALRKDLEVITMSATPIPRTLHMALTGIRDISLIATPPVNRLPVKTFVGEFKPSVIRNAILHEIERGGQVFFLHNRIESIDETAMFIQELVPEASVRTAHGKMQDRELEDVMFSFINQEFQVMVCTTIIETGLDISTANTIIIDNANHFGLAQLYQLRGRVGRSDMQAYGYFLYRPEKDISDTARQRLKAIREFTRLGSGYQIALRDMEIRGVGNVLGAEQHGHMISVGFDLYCKLLNDSIEELKGNKSEESLDDPFTIDLNISAYFPEEWIEEQHQRINEYGRISSLGNEAELNSLISEWQDRFGRLPKVTENLVEIVRIKLLAKKAKITSIAQEGENIKLLTTMRLQNWLAIHRTMDNVLQSRTLYKSGSLGSRLTQPYVNLKTGGMNADQQMDALRHILLKILEAQQ